jgi:NAD(P)H-hydrate epimerase
LRGKAGAASMTGIAALRAGAGLVTIATPDDALDAVAAQCPEYMTAPLSSLDLVLSGKTVLAVGPGLGTTRDAARVVDRIMQECERPVVFDADALNILARTGICRPRGPRILTPHPGEMERLTGSRITDRLATAGTYAQTHNVILVLKGQRTLIAFPDGRIVINPTGSPAMATGGSGDILTGMIAGFLAQFPNEIANAVCAAVYLHGRAGELGASGLGEKCLIATDLLRYLPDAMR